jgi:GT2 family glycosyltransferase
MIETKTKQKIGLGIITCDRPEFLKQVLKSIPFKRIDEVVIIDDGTKPRSGVTLDPHSNLTYLKNEENIGVGRSKNRAMLNLLNKGCTDIFLIEDDIIIKNANVFDEYIKASKDSGLKHLMFGYHGPANKLNKQNNPRVTVEYSNSKIALNQHCVGGFCYYSRDLLMRVGLFDETFVNAWEHVEHSYRAVLMGYLPAYWWWPDIENSCDFLEELACSENDSTIRPRSDWKKNIQDGAKYFSLIYKDSPVSISDTKRDIVLQRLKAIKTKTLWTSM